MTQEMHVDELVAPLASEYLPATHCAHSAEDIQKVPAGHNAQELEPDGEYDPVSTHDWHTEELVAPLATEYSPAAQSVHTPDPEYLEYFPAGQAVHEEAPDGEYFPLSQELQYPELEAPVEVR